MANGILFSIGIYNMMIWFDLEPKYKVKFIRIVLNAFICIFVVLIAMLLEKDTWLYVSLISGVMIGLTQHQKKEMFDYIYQDMKREHRRNIKEKKNSKNKL